MSKDIIPLDDQPRVLYLYKGPHDQLMVLAIKQDLACVLNFTATRAPLLAPQTPEPVRRMLYTKQFLQSREKKVFLERMLLHTTPSGLCFFEVHLTPEGVAYIKARNSGGLMHADDYHTFEAYGPRPTASGLKPTPRLEEALNYLGLNPIT